MFLTRKSTSIGLRLDHLRRDISQLDKRCSKHCENQTRSNQWCLDVKNYLEILKGTQRILSNHLCWTTKSGRCTELNGAMNDGSPPISLFQDGLAIGVLTAALPFHIMQLNQWRNTTLLFVFLNRSYAFPSPASYLASMMAPYALLHRDYLLKASSLSNAYPFFRRAATSYRLLLRLELECSFLRTPRDECILGIGVCLDAGARTLSFEFDWLIMEALDAFNIRRSFHKRRFDFFLPLTFDRSHFVRVPKSIWTRFGTIEEALREAENDISRKMERPSNKRLHSSLHPHETVEILYRMMNNIVLSQTKSCVDLLLVRVPKTTASSRFGKGDRILLSSISSSHKSMSDHTCNPFTMPRTKCGTSLANQKRDSKNVGQILGSSSFLLFLSSSFLPSIQTYPLSGRIYAKLFLRRAMNECAMGPESQLRWPTRQDQDAQKQRLCVGPFGEGIAVVSYRRTSAAHMESSGQEKDTRLCHYQLYT